MRYRGTQTFELEITTHSMDKGKVRQSDGWIDGWIDRQLAVAQLIDWTIRLRLNTQLAGWLAKGK